MKGLLDPEDRKAYDPPHPNLSAQAAAIRANRQPAPWPVARTIGQFVLPQTAGDVALEGALIAPLPPPARVALAAASMLLGDPSEAQAGPFDRAARRIGGALAHGAETAATGVRRAADEGWGAATRRADDGPMRYDASHDPTRPPVPPERPLVPSGEAGPPAALPGPPRAAADPEGRQLTAPLIFGRDAEGNFLLHQPGQIGLALDQLAGRVFRDTPASDLPRGVLGRVELPRWHTPGQGEQTRRLALVRILAGQPVGGWVEAHEAGHLAHLIRSGEARLTPRARRELTDLHARSIQGYRARDVPNELYAEGIASYLLGGSAARQLIERAPAAAALFRSHVNADPVLSRIFQLNSLFPLGLLGAGGGAGLLARPEGDAP